MNVNSRYLLLSLLFITIGINNIFCTQTQIEINNSEKKLLAPKAVSYQWYYNGEKLDGENLREIVIEKSGEYAVITEDLDGSLKSVEITVEVTATSIRKIWVIGDSTASTYSGSLFPRTGWGQVLQAFFRSDSITVMNKALSGRSSKSFLTDANGWPVVLRGLAKGDFLFIQFAHNDEKSDDTTRYTEPYTTFKYYLSIYIDSARNRGAYPVLLTPVNRNSWSGGMVTNSHGDYPAAMRQLASEKNVPLIDLLAKTKERWEELGQDYVTNNIYMNLPAGIFPNYPDGNSDNTHFQEEGAFEVCKLIYKALKEQKVDTVLNIIEQNSVNAGYVKVMPDPVLSATFTGAGVKTEGTTVEIKATPKTGYAIDSWLEADTLLSMSHELSFRMDTTIRKITAKMGTGYVVTLSRTPSAGGTAAGNGSFLVGSQVTITAVPNNGYRFVSWKKNDLEVSTDSAYTFLMGDSNESYTAVFEIASTINISNQQVKEVNVYLTNQNNIKIESGAIINFVKIYDPNGKLIRVDKINTNDAEISLDKYSGIVLIKIETQAGTVVKKLVVHN